MKGYIGEKLKVKITSKTKIECEVINTDVEFVDPNTPILVFLKSKNNF